MPASKYKSLLSRYPAYAVLPPIAHAASRSFPVSVDSPDTIHHPIQLFHSNAIHPDKHLEETSLFERSIRFFFALVGVIHQQVYSAPYSTERHSSLERSIRFLRKFSNEENETHLDIVVKGKQAWQSKNDYFVRQQHYELCEHFYNSTIKAL
jgi:hypothetical protein